MRRLNLPRCPPTRTSRQAAQWATAMAWLVAAFAAGASPLPRVLETVQAPPLEEARVTESRDLGFWTDVHAPSDHEALYLLRDDTLFRHALDRTDPPIQILKAPELNSARIVGSVFHGTRGWLLFDANGRTPWAYEVNSGLRVEFRVEGLTVGPEERPLLQSFVAMPHAGGALATVSGGGARNWPFPANRPVHFWWHLGTGRTRALPTDYRLSLLSSNELFACLQRILPLPPAPLPPGLTVPRPDPDPEALPAHAWIDLRTGEDVDPPFAIGPSRLTLMIGQDGPLGVGPPPVMREGLGQRQFVGVSVGGRVHPFTIPGFDFSTVGWNALARGDWLAFGTVREGSYLASLNTDRPDPLLVSLGTGVTAFEPVGPGQCVSVVFERDLSRRRTADVAWFADALTGRRWEVLDGVPDRLAPLTNARHVEDRLHVLLARNLGGQGEMGGVLCRVDHRQQDMRAGGFGPGEVPFRASWSAHILVTASGRRYRIQGIEPEPLVRHASYHASGRFVVGTMRPSEQRPGLQLKAFRIEAAVPAKR